MPVSEENIGRVNESNGEAKRNKRAKPNPTMPPTTPITEGTISSVVWLEIGNKLDTLKTFKTSKKKPD